MADPGTMIRNYSPSSWERFQVEERFVQRRGLHKSETRAKKEGGMELPGIMAATASVERSAKPLVLMLCGFFPHKQRDAPSCSAGDRIKQKKV